MYLTVIVVATRRTYIFVYIIPIAIYYTCDIIMIQKLLP